MKAKDLTGQKIGKLKVLERKRENRRTYYYCKCDCGTKKWMRADQLIKSKSCGCLAKETQFKANNITGKRYGNLIALEPTAERDERNGAVIWKCKCDCGEICYVSANNLGRGGTRSCGCLRRKSSQNNIKKAITKHLDEHIIDGTNIPIISRTTPKANNTSGRTGVGWDKARQKWAARIKFKGKLYHLGRSTNKQEAIEAREKAEDKLFKPFLDSIKK